MNVKRLFVGVKVGQNGVDWLDQVALEEDGRQSERTITRSDVIRSALAFAARNDRDFRRFMRGNNG